MTPFEWGVTDQSGFANGTFVRSENLKPLEPKLEHEKGQRLRTHIKTLLGKMESRNSNLKRKSRRTYAFQGDTLLMYAVISHVLEYRCQSPNYAPVFLPEMDSQTLRYLRNL